MNIALTGKADTTRVATIRGLNDRFRQTLSGGAVLLTSGIIALGAENQARILEAVRDFDDFDADDPWDHHDIGDFEIEVTRRDGHRQSALIFFRIDRPTGTEPLLSLMFAEEW